MPHARQTKAVMPIRPRALVELTSLSVRQDFSKHLISYCRNKCLYVSVVADMHDLGNHSFRHENSILWRFPPGVLAGKRRQGFSTDPDHDGISSTHFYGPGP